MGKRIDAIALTALLAGVLYVFFMSALKSAPLAAAAALLALTILRKLASPFSGKRRKKSAATRDARNTLEVWANKSTAEAKELAAKLICAAYPNQVTSNDIVLLSRHPLGEAVRIDDIFAAWKSRGSAGGAVVVTFTRASDVALAFARTLDKPKINVIDAPRLMSLLEKYPEYREKAVKPDISRRARLKAAAIKGVISARAGRCALTGALMCLMYFITGKTAYLLTGVIIIYIACAAARRRGDAKKLFAD